MQEDAGGGRCAHLTGRCAGMDKVRGNALATLTACGAWLRPLLTVGGACNKEHGVLAHAGISQERDRPRRPRR